MAAGIRESFDDAAAAHAAAAHGALPLDGEAFAALMRPFGRLENLLLAVSGGPDSTALMGLAAGWSRVHGTPVAVATVDHGLRSDSRGEAAAVARAAGALGLPHAILEWRGPVPHTRIQEAARDARYGLLVAHAGTIGATHLATGHTLDDQAETILHRLARGSGPAGLIGMRASTPRGRIVHVRPLLPVRKANLVAVCEANGWTYLRDPSNVDPRYARTRWRRIARQLEIEGLAPGRFAVLSQRLARAEAALVAALDAAYPGLVRHRAGGRVDLDATALAALPEELLLRVVARALDEVAPPGGAPPLRLQRLERLCADLRAATATGMPFKRSLGGAIVWARSAAMVEIQCESGRRGAGRT